MKAYMFDVTWNVSKNYKIKAESYEEAYKIMNDMLNSGNISYFDDGYESVDSNIDGDDQSCIDDLTDCDND